MFNVILTIVFLLIPVVVAAVDKKRKKEKRSPSVHAEPIDFSEVEAERTPGNEILEHEKSLLTPESSITLHSRPASVKPVPKSRPRQEARRKPVEKDVTEEEITVETVKKDRRKLILYSEILKPKFDE